MRVLQKDRKKVFNISSEGFVIAVKKLAVKMIICEISKGQLISKGNCQAVNSSKKRTNEFVFTTIRRVFVRFLEEIEDTQKTFRNCLTFISSKLI